MRVHRRALARAQTRVEHPDPFVFEQDLMVIGRRRHRIQCVLRIEWIGWPTRSAVAFAHHAATPLTGNMERNDTRFVWRVSDRQPAGIR
jgi:hypothetical protein